MIVTAEQAAFEAATRANPADITAKLVYADWLDEQGDSIRAAWLRADGVLPPQATTFHGDGHGYGYGSGDGHGYGSGDGYGYGYGDGHGYGYGSGDGHGYGSGDGHGDGDGHGHGDGDGHGHGDGDGHGRKTQINRWVINEEIAMPEVGQYVVVRTRDQGCMCGEYRCHHGREVTLANARQIFSWAGARLTLIDFAAVPGECRLSRVAPGDVVLLEACGIIPTTPEVESFLRAHQGE